MCRSAAWSFPGTERVVELVCQLGPITTLLSFAASAPAPAPAELQLLICTNQASPRFPHATRRIRCIALYNLSQPLTVSSSSFLSQLDCDTFSANFFSLFSNFFASKKILCMGNMAEAVTRVRLLASLKTGLGHPPRRPARLSTSPGQPESALAAAAAQQLLLQRRTRRGVTTFNLA